MLERSERICKCTKDGDKSGPDSLILRRTEHSGIPRLERLAFAALAIPAILYAGRPRKSLAEETERFAD